MLGEGYTDEAEVRSGLVYFTVVYLASYLPSGENMVCILLTLKLIFMANRSLLLLFMTYSFAEREAGKELVLPTTKKLHLHLGWSWTHFLKPSIMRAKNLLF